MILELNARPESRPARLRRRHVRARCNVCCSSNGCRRFTKRCSTHIGRSCKSLKPHRHAGSRSGGRVRVAITRDCQVWFATDRITPENLPAAIRERVSRGAERRVYIKADYARTIWRRRAGIGECTFGGVSNLNFKSQQQTGEKPCECAHGQSNNASTENQESRRKRRREHGPILTKNRVD